MANYVTPITETPTAKILFRGLKLMCFNCINGKRQLEIGFIPCAEHFPTIEIKVIHDAGPPIAVKNRISTDLHFFARGATVDEIIPLQSPVWGFHPHHADIEGPFLHGRKVDVNTTLISTGLRVNAGSLYTHEPVQQGIPFCVDKWLDASQPGDHHKHFGKLASFTGVNIQCPVSPDNGIDIVDGEGKLRSCLPSRPGTRYVITIESDCMRQAGHSHREPRAGHTTDFRLYYTSNVINVNGDKYDFADYGNHRTDPKRSPDVCVTGFLGLTDTLGLPIIHANELNEKAKSINKQRELRKRG